MKQLHCILISCLTFLLGIFLYLAHQYVIFLKPFATQIFEKPSSIVSKKKVTLYVWDQEAWKHEIVEIIWSDNLIKTLEYVLIAWLAFLDEEKTNNKKISLQSVAIGPSGQEAYISFDRNPFEKKNIAFDKWLWIESLLKTLRKNKITLKSIQLLVHHQPLIDYHIDFSKPWPLEGFLKE